MIRIHAVSIGHYPDGNGHHNARTFDVQCPQLDAWCDKYLNMNYSDVIIGIERLPDEPEGEKEK